MSAPVSETASAALQEPETPVEQPRGGRTPWWANQRVGLLILVVALSALFGILRPAFFNQQLVVFPLLRDIAMFTVVGLAQLCVLSIGHMNLAVGRMAAFSMMLTGISYDLWGFSLYAGLLVGLVAGTAIGALAGWVIARTGVNSFVVTLALDFLLLGLIPLVYTGLTDNAAFVTKPPGMRELRNYSLADVCIGNVCGSPAIPQLAMFAVIAMVVIGWIYSRTKLGRELLMTGTSVKAAELSGIPTARRVITAHALSGCLAALAGFMLAVSTGSIKATVGEEFMLPSFLGPILGGTLLAGGFISVWGTLLGTALTSVIRKGLDLLGVGLESLNIYLGLILLVALSTDRIRTVLSDRQGGAKTMRRFTRSTEMTLLVICVVFFVGLVIASGGDLLESNSLRVLLQFLAVPVLIGLAQMVVLAVGQLNLAVGAIGGFAAVAMGVLMADHGVPVPLALLIGFLLAAVAGLLNGLLVVLTRINGFIVTLATMTVLLGVQYRLVGTRTVDAYPQGLKSFGSYAVFGVLPLIFLVALVVAALLAVMLRRTVPGRQLLASGGNPIAARLSGISNDGSVILAHTLSGAILGVAAILTVASSPGVNKSIGGDWLLPSFAAPIIGGALLTGGSAVVLGTVLAAFIVRFVDTARAEFSLEPSWVNFVVGTVVLGSVVLGQLRTRRQERRTVVKAPDAAVAGGVS